MLVSAQPVILGVTKKKAINGQTMENVMEKKIQPAPSPFKADVWKHFEFYNIDGTKELDKTYVICKLCTAKVKYFGYTTNLRTHMARHHPEDANEVKPKVRNIPGDQHTLHQCCKLPTNQINFQPSEYDEVLYLFLNVMLWRGMF